jgi:kynurenine formamidase
MSAASPASDERGALARIGAEEVLGALGLVRTGRIVDLCMPLGPETPAAGHRHGFVRFMNRDGGDYAAGAKRPGGFQFAEDTVLMPTHIGTHIDALAHVWYDGLLFGGHPQETIRSNTGAQRCGADKLGPLISRGVLLDVAHDRTFAAGEAIGAEDLEREAIRSGVDVRAGDVVLIRTGWLGQAGHSSDAYFAGEPGIDVAAARWLASAGVVAIGCDNFAVEHIPFPDGEAFPVHQVLLRDFGIPLLEGVVLDQLAGLVNGPFLFVALPLTLVGCTASPVAPVAVL